jgi:hypothetical protein
LVTPLCAAPLARSIQNNNVKILQSRALAFAACMALGVAHGLKKVLNVSLWPILSTVARHEPKDSHAKKLGSDLKLPSLSVASLECFKNSKMQSQVKLAQLLESLGDGLIFATGSELAD